MLNSLSAIRRPRDVDFTLIGAKSFAQAPAGRNQPGGNQPTSGSPTHWPTNSTHPGCIEMRSRRASPEKLRIFHQKGSELGSMFPVLHQAIQHLQQGGEFENCALHVYVMVSPDCHRAVVKVWPLEFCVRPASSCGYAGGPKRVRLHDLLSIITVTRLRQPLSQRLVRTVSWLLSEHCTQISYLLCD